MIVALIDTCFNNNPSSTKKRFVNIYCKFFEKLWCTEFIVFELKDCSIKDCFLYYDNIKYIKTSLLSTNSIQKHIYGF